MKKASAKAVSKLMLNIGHDLAKSLAVVKRKETPADFNAYRQSVAEILTVMLVEVMNPIYAEHPELRPPQLK